MIDERQFDELIEVEAKALELVNQHWKGMGAEAKQDTLYAPGPCPACGGGLKYIRDSEKGRFLVWCDRPSCLTILEDR